MSEPEDPEEGQEPEHELDIVIRPEDMAGVWAQLGSGEPQRARIHHRLRSARLLIWLSAEQGHSRRSSGGIASVHNATNRRP